MLLGNVISLLHTGAPHAWWGTMYIFGGDDIYNLGIDRLKVIEQVHAMGFNDFTTISSLHVHPWPAPCMHKQSEAACRVLVKERKVRVNRGPSLLTSRIAEERIERAAGNVSVSPPRPVAKQSPRCFRPPCGKSLFIRKCNLIQEADSRAPWERSLIGGLIDGRPLGCWQGGILSVYTNKQINPNGINNSNCFNKGPML